MALVWVLVAAALALMVLLWGAMQAMGAGERLVGWAMVLVGLGLAVMPRAAGGLAGGWEYASLLLLAGTVLIAAGGVCFLRLRRRVPLVAWMGIGVLVHLWLALAVFALLPQATATGAMGG